MAKKQEVSQQEIAQYLVQEMAKEFKKDQAKKRQLKKGYQMYRTYLLGMQFSNPDNYLSFEEIERVHDDDEGEGVFVNISSLSPPTPEYYAIEKERWQNLREETKQVIQMVLDCPVELFTEITGNPNAKQMTGKQISRYLRKAWGERTVVREIFQEIKQYLNYNMG